MAESWLMVVEGSWQGSPTNNTFLTPVCRGINRLGYVDCAASSTIKHPKNPLNLSILSDPLLLKVVKIMSASSILLV